MEMIVCPDCGKENAITATTCVGCGFPLSSLARCPDCGTICTNEVEICSKCGCPLKSKKQSIKPQIPMRTIAVILVVVIAIFSVFLVMNKSKNDFQDKLVAGSPWSDALTDDTIDFNDNGTLVCYAIDNYGGVYGGMEYKIATCEYKVKPGNKIVIGGKTVDVSFRVDGKIIFEPDIYPLIKQEAKN